MKWTENSRLGDRILNSGSKDVIVLLIRAFLNQFHGKIVGGNVNPRIITHGSQRAEGFDTKT